MKVVAQHLLNTPVAGDCDTASWTGYVRIGGMPPILLTDLQGVDILDRTVEVAQLVTVTMPTVVLSTRYGIRLGNHLERREEFNRRPRLYAMTADAVLSGSADTDKLNVWGKIAAGINSIANNNVWAGPSVVLTHAATAPTPGGFTVGNYVVGSVSFAKGKVTASTALTATVIILNGKIFADNETLTEYTDQDATIPTGETGVGAATIISAYNGTFLIQDKPLYYPVKGFRKGASEVAVGPDLVEADVVVTTDAAYSFGIGSVMVDFPPVKEIGSNNINNGYLWFAQNETPLVANVYKRATLRYQPSVSESALSPLSGSATLVQEVWYERAGGAAFEAALLAL